MHDLPGDIFGINIIQVKPRACAMACIHFFNGFFPQLYLSMEMKSKAVLPVLLKFCIFYLTVFVHILMMKIDKPWPNKPLCNQGTQAERTLALISIRKWHFLTQYFDFQKNWNLLKSGDTSLIGWWFDWEKRNRPIGIVSYKIEYA